MPRLLTRRSSSLQAVLVPLGAITLVQLIAIGHAEPPMRRLMNQDLVPHESPPVHPPMPTPPQPAPGTGGPAGDPIEHNGYVSYQVNIDEFGNNIVGDAANEPSIAIDPNFPNRMAIGWRQFNSVESDFREAGYAYTQDAGRTWSFTGVLAPGIFGTDPVLASNRDGDFYYATLTSVTSGLVYVSTDTGVSWQPTGGSPSLADKEWMAIDRTEGIGSGNIYIAHSFTLQIDRSTDGGVTWTESDACLIDSASHATLCVASDGVLYLIDRNHYLIRSTDAQDPATVPTCEYVATVHLGGSESGHTGPNPGGLLGQPWIDCDSSGGPLQGNLYALRSVDPPGSGDPMDVKFSRSTDGGFTWSDSTRVNDDPADNGAWQWFGAMSVAPNGRIDAVWYDTRNAPTDDEYLSEVFYSYSEDGGVTWSKNVAISPPFDPHVGWPQQNKIGDYIHVLSRNDGANLAYAATFNGEQDVYFVHIGIYDCNENGTSDEVDIESGASTDCNANIVPDECEPDCNANGVADPCDIADGTSEDCNSNLRPDECDVDCDADGQPDDCQLDDGQAPDCNANGVPDECDVESGASSDCNANEIPDECDADCDGNGVPDDCDPDCNSNGHSDACDILDGTAMDCNSDGIPDECGNCCTSDALMLVAEDQVQNDDFAIAVAMYDDIAVIGASGDAVHGSNSGAAYVFRRDASTDKWLQEAKFAAFDGASGDGFGSCLAAWNDAVLVCAPYDDDAGTSSGAVYAFHFDSQTGEWVLTGKLLPDDGASNDEFGNSVSIHGDVAAIGARGDDDNGSNSGSVYVFRYDAVGAVWEQEAKLIAADGTSGDRFGSSAAVYGDHALIGANLDDGGGPATGSAYLFRYDSDFGEWNEQMKLKALDAAPFDRFGTSVALASDVALVGAIGDDDNGSSSGAAYDFRQIESSGEWTQEAKLVPASGIAGDFFGGAVGLFEGLAVIVAQGADGSVVDSGAAFVFSHDATLAAWTEQSLLTPTGDVPDNRLREAVAIHGQSIVVGAQYTDGSGSGSAYLFTGLSDCNDNGSLDLCDITLGLSLDENDDGVPDECECSGPANGDSDDDGDVDLRDAAAFAACFDPFAAAPDPCSCAFDADKNKIIELGDFAAFNDLLTGP